MKCSEFIKLLEKAGWQPVRQKGSHVIMRHPNKENPISVPNHGSKEIATGTAETLKKQAGLK